MQQSQWMILLGLAVCHVLQMPMGSDRTWSRSRKDETSIDLDPFPFLVPSPSVAARLLE